MQKIGQGTLTSGRTCSGTLRAVETVQDVLRLMKTDLSETILLTSSASATAVIPLFSKVKGVVCTAGGATSHLAIVAREFDLPCVMGSEMTSAPEMDGRAVLFNEQGEIFLQG
jgi:phosphohistidine swiveling domain-containing protein